MKKELIIGFLVISIPVTVVYFILRAILSEEAYRYFIYVINLAFIYLVISNIFESEDSKRVLEKTHDRFLKLIGKDKVD